jgi:hypothetical protein
MKEYILKPIMTPATVVLCSKLDKSVVARSVPPRQPLPTATIVPVIRRLEGAQPPVAAVTQA